MSKSNQERKKSAAPAPSKSPTATEHSPAELPDPIGGFFFEGEYDDLRTKQDRMFHLNRALTVLQYWAHAQEKCSSCGRRVEWGTAVYTMTPGKDPRPDLFCVNCGWARLQQQCALLCRKQHHDQQGWVSLRLGEFVRECLMILGKREEPAQYEFQTRLE